MENRRTDLRDMTLNELENLCLYIGEKKYRAQQIFRWLYSGIDNIDNMPNLPEQFREKLKTRAYISKVIVERKYESSIDGTVKYLLKLEDGNIIESVFMRYSFGISVCLSTQVGCRMGCSFCASTIGGMVRNLTAGEIANEILIMQNESNERVSNIVLMGTGEPLDNFFNVTKFLKLVNSEKGLNIGMRHITLSTCGLVPEIVKLAELELQITLAVSLHAPNDEIRKKLMPIANKYTIVEILKACQYYIEKTNRRITFEYSMIKGVNDSLDNARELSNLLKRLLCHVNLIPVNEIEGKIYIKADTERIAQFRKILENSGIETTIRRELGADINAACGQLRKNYIN